MRAATRSAAVIGLLAAALAWPDAGGAHDRGPRPVKTQVQTDLAPCCGDVEPAAEGRAGRITTVSGDVTQRDRFRVKVTVPVPSTGLGIADEAAARAVEVHVVLSHSGVDYADCTLGVLDVESEDEEGAVTMQAEYGVDVTQSLRHGNPVVKAQHGQCDVDLDTEGVQSGVPAVEANDVAVVYVVGAGGNTSFLQGFFAPGGPAHH
jgi:hypothetical protein